MCTVLLPPGDNPIAVNKYIISLVIKSSCYCLTCSCRHVYQSIHFVMYFNLLSLYWLGEIRENQSIHDAVLPFCYYSMLLSPPVPSACFFFLTSPLLQKSSVGSPHTTSRIHLTAQ